MPSITFTDDVVADATSIISYFDSIIDDGILISESTDRVVFRAGDLRFVVKGSDFEFTGEGSERALTGGTVDKLIVFEDGVRLVTLNELGLSFDILGPVIAAESTGADPAALENLLLSMDWDYTGNSGADILPSDAVTSDGIPFNLAGNDTAHLGDGDDDFYFGLGDDIGYGEDGDDILDGCDGNDILIGGRGSDTLIGGAESDKLNGQGGADILIGGSGDDLMNGGGRDDILEGGLGIDRMSGGAGADTFIFEENGGRDTITDFSVGEDMLQFLNTGEIELRENANGTLVIYETGRVLLVDIALETIQEGDIVVISEAF